MSGVMTSSVSIWTDEEVHTPLLNYWFDIEDRLPPEKVPEGYTRRWRSSQREKRYILPTYSVAVNSN